MGDIQRGVQAFERLLKADEGVKTGTCKKCGGGGHLTFECRNMFKLEDNTPKPKKSSRFGFIKSRLGSTSASPSPASDKAEASPARIANVDGADPGQTHDRDRTRPPAASLDLDHVRHPLVDATIVDPGIVQRIDEAVMIVAAVVQFDEQEQEQEQEQKQKQGQEQGLEQRSEQKPKLE
ncbi:hypothetical protein BGW42_000667 [Actinomortierella wolfii]|nr:hypothetical protein BGW42_000667 [Actinomortierella wolfii]